MKIKMSVIKFPKYLVIPYKFQDFTKSLRKIVSLVRPQLENEFVLQELEPIQQLFPHFLTFKQEVVYSTI